MWDVRCEKRGWRGVGELHNVGSPASYISQRPTDGARTTHTKPNEFRRHPNVQNTLKIQQPQAGSFFRHFSENGHQNSVGFCMRPSRTHCTVHVHINDITTLRHLRHNDITTLRQVTTLRHYFPVVLRHITTLRHYDTFLLLHYDTLRHYDITTLRHPVNLQHYDTLRHITTHYDTLRHITTRYDITTLRHLQQRERHNRHAA